MMTLHAGLVVATVGFVVRDALAGVFYYALALANSVAGECALALDSRLSYVEVTGVHVGDLRRRNAHRLCGGLARHRLLLAYRHQFSSATIIARHSPKPIRTLPSRSQYPRIITSSPSSRNCRSSPVGRANGSAPRRVISSRHPRSSFPCPDTVPLAMRSPGRRSQPLLVWCATICAMVQYMSLNVPWLNRTGAMS